MKYILTLSLFALIGCNWLSFYDAPDDFVYHPPEPIEEPIDTIIPPDTCAGLIEYTDPAFVTLYMKFDEPQNSVLWEGGGFQSYSLAEVVNHITGLPAKVDTAPIGGNVILKGTNNHAQFQLKVFTRIDGGKWYMGTAKQGLILPGSNAAYFKENMHEYPSYNEFSFWGVDCTCEQGIELSREPLKDCHAGRWYADLFYLPCQPPQSTRDSLVLYGWDRVRASSRPLVIDLRGKKGYDLQALAATGAQIIVSE